MTDREICEQIVKQGNCIGVECKEHDCPIDCCGDYANVVGYAKKWLAEHPISERKLNEQWVRDGIMYKAIKKGERCVIACSFIDEPTPDGLTFIELGILNNEGLIPCSRCGSYPSIIEDNGFFSFFHICTGDDDAMVKTESRMYGSRKECVDACNRRV